MYKIKSWMPDRTLQSNGASFGIVLTPDWKAAVAKSKIDQETVDTMIRRIGSAVLEGHGMAPELDLRMIWGEWGPEYIRAPGNACELHLDQQPIGILPGEAQLVCHNVDSLVQASILLTLFLRIAEILEYENTEYPK